MNLGDEVKDRVTGFRGIAVSRHTFLQGCARITIQPPVGKDGRMVDAQSFDEPQLMVIKAGVVKRAADPKNPGGPEKYETTDNRMEGVCRKY